MNTTDNSSTNYTCIICSHTVDQSITILQIIFGLLLLVGNSVTLVTLTKCRTMKRTIRLSLINLSITDIGLGIVFVYHYAVVYEVFNDMIECRIRYILVCLLSGATISTVTFLSIERLIALKMPFRYQQIVTTTTITIAIVMSWLGPTLVILPIIPYSQKLQECNYMFITDRNADIVFSFINFFYLTTIVTCHVMLYRGARAQISKIIPTFIGKERRETEQRMNMKATMSTTIILLPYIVCSTPLYVFFLIMALYPDIKQHIESLYTVNALYNLSAFTSFVNPFIYTWKLPQLRTTFRRMCPCPAKQNNETQVTLQSTSRPRNNRETKAN